MALFTLCRLPCSRDCTPGGHPVPPRSERRSAVNPTDGPLDPFLNDPFDPASALDELEVPPPLSEAERADVAADLAELTQFRAALAPRGVQGVVVECSDCGESHYFGWSLMAANLEALLGEGATRAHEPAFNPDPGRYVTWEYARGFSDALSRHSLDR
jgi:Family of unknown function (DUF5319)